MLLNCSIVNTINRSRRMTHCDIVQLEKCNESIRAESELISRRWKLYSTGDINRLMGDDQQAGLRIANCVFHTDIVCLKNHSDKQAIYSMRWSVTNLVELFIFLKHIDCQFHNFAAAQPENVISLINRYSVHSVQSNRRPVQLVMFSLYSLTATRIREPFPRTHSYLS